ncbi:G patch domain-containing protein 4 [Papilio machaon]|uniref:G patch domain-containing protein 4 n=1 Tax=Papilio machaon TaxID=76193 RepID=A0A194QZA5_PAPMA|nr:G patch domain-containing protein 4 [Papilio machaon]
MDFARKQLEKYGWSAGKGLGKHENGISEALKPKLKRSVAGVGHDPAADFTEHWWNDLYNKAAKNLEVENKNGKTRRIKRKNSSDFEITNNTWQIKKNKKGEKSDQGYTDFFVKTAILNNGESKVENVKECDSENEKTVRDIFKMTDEELFAACEGRTAHKGARHGLKALGKLARIEQQEQLLLNQDKYKGYSHTKKGKSIDQEVKINDQIEETNSLEIDTDSMPVKKKKKKRNKDIEEKESQTNSNEIHAKDDDQLETFKGNEKEMEASYQPADDDNVDVKKKKKRKNYEVQKDVQSKKEKDNSDDASDTALAGAAAGAGARVLASAYSQWRSSYECHCTCDRSFSNFATYLEDMDEDLFLLMENVADVCFAK